MNDVPQVAIVGQPNVGKSTLLNRMAGRRVSIVHGAPGVTRDRVAIHVTRDDRTIEFVDTGGIGMTDREALAPRVQEQIEYALGTAAAVVFVVDVQAGVTPLDQEVAARLRHLDRPVIVVANKADNAALEQDAAGFWSFGMGEPLPVSALHGRGILDLLDRVFEVVPAAEAPADPVLRIAILGKRNVGKSTFVNALCHEERMIVSEVPGTTRDAVDVRFERDGEVFLAIDTAGAVRPGRGGDPLEWYARHRAMRAVRRADVTLLLIDVAEPVTKVEKALADTIVSEFRPCVIVGNKWDLAEGRMTPEDYGTYLRRKLPGVAYAPIVLVSARRGERIHDAVRVAADLKVQAATRVATGPLNRVLEEAVSRRSPPIYRGVQGRLYFGAQTGTAPPTIVLFVNKPTLFPDDYRRYLAARLREVFPLPEVPIRILVRERTSFFERGKGRKGARGGGGAAPEAEGGGEDGFPAGEDGQPGGGDDASTEGAGRETEEG